ncbi:SNAP25 homologous protein SNAP33-like [Aristolochia californica]|uniref:SNAP25 homologous protein SNAP33-like n=1 Tax=Aristolochia californica TaxID=171875 RepID=UPI0035D8CAC4
MFRNRQRSADPVVPASNPFDSDSESDPKQTAKGSKTSSAFATGKPSSRVTPTSYSDDEASMASSASANSAKIKRGSRDMGNLENKTTQELEDYAVNKAEEVTKDVNTCLKIAEDIKDEASKTLVTLHQQGEQITRTHMTAANMEHDLSMGEKLLGSLGGIFSKTWKPKKARAITGPKITRDESSFKRRAAQADQKERHGLIPNQKKPSKSQQKPATEPSSALEKVEVEKGKQDDALSDLSNVLDQLKDMAVGMGTEIERQNKSLDHLHDDVEELNSRVKGANQRGRRLLGK